MVADGQVFHAGPGAAIRLFLVDGNPYGVIVAEIINWVGKVLVAPRARIVDLLRRPELARTGIYLLAGPDPERSDAGVVYVGEADDVSARLRFHLSSGEKDFFDRAAVIVSSDDNLTKSHVRYLESRLIRSVTEAGTVRLTNNRAPEFRRLPEADLAAMDYFLSQLRIVLPILGFDLFRPAATSPTAPTRASEVEFGFSPSGAAARARETNDGFVVLAGSTARAAGTGTFPSGYAALRDALLRDGRLVPTDNGLLRFANDVTFASPSAAAAIVAGRSATGPGEWKVVDTGQTYRDWKAAELEEA